MKWATPEIGSTTMTILSDWPVSLTVSRYGLAARLYLHTRDTCAECIAETTTEEGPDEDTAARACTWAESIIGTAELRERVCEIARREGPTPSDPRVRRWLSEQRIAAGMLLHLLGHPAVRIGPMLGLSSSWWYDRCRHRSITPNPCEASPSRAPRGPDRAPRRARPKRSHAETVAWVREHPGATMRELATARDVTRQRAHQLVTALVKSGQLREERAPRTPSKPHECRFYVA